MEYSNLQRKIIVIDCLEDAQLISYVNTEWEKRFADDDAIHYCWDSEKEDMENTAHFGTTVQEWMGAECVLAFLVDLRSRDAKEIADRFQYVQEKLSRVAGANIVMSLQLGYVGQFSLMGEEEKATLRDHVKSLIAQNQNGNRLYLLAEKGFDNTHVCCLHALVLLDLLRRANNITEVVPAEYPNGNDVGYIRYGCYDERPIRELTGEIRKLEKELSLDTLETLDQCIRDKKTEIEQQIEKRTRIDMSFVPYDPNLVQTGHRAVKKAEKGSNEVYKRALENTVAAVVETGNGLDCSLQQYVEELGREDLIGTLFTAANLSKAARAKKDSILQKLLAFRMGTIDNAPALPQKIPYGKEREVFQRYLEQMADNAVRRNTAALVDLLGRWYDEDGYASPEKLEELENLAKDKAAKQNKLDAMQTRDAFLASPIAEGGIQMIVGAGIFHENFVKKKIVRYAKGQGPNNMAEASEIYISEQFGHVKQPDTCPCKYMEVYDFEYTDAVGEKLLKELLP